MKKFIMKNLEPFIVGLILSVLTLLLMSCEAEQLQTENKTATEPVNNLNGVYNHVGNQYWVSLGWFTQQLPYTYTNTVKYGNTIVSTNYYNLYNQITIPVTRRFRSGTFYVSQTVNGVESVFMSTVVVKDNLNKK